MIKYLIYILLFPVGLIAQTISVATVGVQDKGGIPIKVEHQQTVFSGSDSIQVRIYSGFYPREHWYSLNSDGVEIDATVGCWTNGSCTPATWTSANTWYTYHYSLTADVYSVNIYDGFGDGFNGGQVEVSRWENGAWKVIWLWTGISNNQGGSGYGTHTNWQVEGTREFTVTGATSTMFVDQGWDTTDVNGEVSFANPNSYPYRATIDVSGMQSTLIERDMLYMMYMRMFPDSMKSWDFHTCDFDGDGKVTEVDIKEAYNHYISGDPVTENYVYDQAEKDNIEVNATTATFHQQYVKSSTRSIDNISRFYIVSLGKHRKSSPNKLITQ